MNPRIDTTPLPDNPLLIAEAALRFRAKRAGFAAAHAIGCTSEDAVRDATKYHYEMIAYRVAAALCEDLNRDRCPARDLVEGEARAHLRTTKDQS